ncbi:MAG: late competence development ComFB family protein [Treponema sp.]|jgi:competence protein ComFB|nr:late competence development ComFB family protein [Treponema sp.]
MAIHNIIEDIVLNEVDTIFESIKKEGNTENFCFCEQCRMDTACFVLNRSEPCYIVSNRGIARLGQDGFERQQLEADIASLIHKGLMQVQHNQRPTASHGNEASVKIASSLYAFDIPVMVGRIFDGTTFAPLTGVKVELYSEGKQVPMKDHNWQNPYTLVQSTAGHFTFWPEPVSAETPDDQKMFEYSMRVEASEYESITHFFKVTATSKALASTAFSMERTYKLPDLYLFPPDQAELDW